MERRKKDAVGECVYCGKIAFTTLMEFPGRKPRPMKDAAWLAAGRAAAKDTKRGELGVSALLGSGRNGEKVSGRVSAAPRWVAENGGSSDHT
jgi:hypothetical protein